jgi:23S rRNA (guanosine2251-2'-O)-methyltransferase
MTPARGNPRRPSGGAGAGRVGGGGGGGGGRDRGGAGFAGGRRAPARSGRPDQREPSELGGDQVEGRRAVLELLTVGRRTVRTILLAEDQDPSPQLDRIEELAARLRIPVETVPRPRLDAQARTESPQGVLAFAKPIEPVPLEDLCQPSRKGLQPFLLVAAGITDPRNLGALLRSAECAGVTGVVLPRHRSARLSPTVAKTASGAIEHLPFAVVGGIPAALMAMKDLGVWSIGLAGESEQSLYDMPLGDGPIALVVGEEEKGLAPLVRRRCDAVVSIPQHGSLPSLNVGVAGAVAAFEVARQRAQAARAQA